MTARPPSAVLGTGLRAALLVSCGAFVCVGLVLAVAGGSALMAPWRRAAAVALFDRPDFPTELTPLVGLTHAILGGSIVGKWLAAAWLVRGPLSEGHRWALRALALGLGSWFLLDSMVSLAMGAWFNVWMINLAPLVTFGGLLLWARAKIGAPSTRPPRPARAWRWLELVCWAFAAMGVVLALGSHTVVFAPYRDAVAQTLLGPASAPTGLEHAVSGHAWKWFRFAYALIGATFLGHFVMLAMAVRHAPGRRWTLEAIAVSMLGWFCIDATLSVVHGAWFNVWMVDLPSLIAVAVPWGLARATAQ